MARYAQAGDDLLAEAREGSLTEYAKWGFVAEALWENGQLRHVVNSQQGVPQELVDQHGKLVWQGTFDDWGKLIAEQGTTTCRLRLPGQIADDETGLHYNRFRYYSPDAGQFVSADPIGFGGGPNEYRFASDAVNWVDPLGLNCPDNACRIYRGMKDAGGTPEVGPTARTLGARPNADIPVDANGMVHPGTGGVSVAPSPQSLPSHRRPPEHGGSGKDPVWGISTADLGPDLRYVPDSPTHGTIQPARPMPIGDYQAALAATGPSWSPA